MNGGKLPAPDADVIKQELDKALNTNINISSYTDATDYQNLLNVRVASSDLPDLFQINDRQTVAQLARKGALLDLTPYVGKLAQAEKFVGGFQKNYVDGKLYALPRAAGLDYFSYWVRKDWLDNLKLPVPQTLDDLAKVAVAFANDDPDQNGKKDTFGLTGGGGGGFGDFKFNPGIGAALSPIFGGYGVGVPGSMYVKDGKVTDALHDPAMKDALAFSKKLFDAKVIDPDVVTNGALQHQQKAIQGQVGIVYIDWANMSKDEYVEQIKAINPKAEWIQINAPKGPGGQFDGTWDSSRQGGIAIPKSLEKNPKKIEKIIELLNYISGEKGSNLVQFGVEGKHFTIDNGKVTATPLLAQDGGYFYTYQFLGRNEMKYLATKFVKQTPYIDFISKEPRIMAYNGVVDIPNDYNPADAERYFSEEIIKFLYGKRPLSEYDAFLETLDTQFKYKVYRDSVAAQLKTLGLVK